MAVQFPPMLGSFLQEGYAYQLNAGVRRTKLTNGNAIQRRKANQRTVVNVSMKLTTAQMQVFEVFILKSAWDWFTATLETGEGLRTVECRMIDGSVQNALISKSLYKTQITIELKNTNVIADDSDLTAEYVEAFYIYGLNDIQQAETVNPLTPLVGV